MMLERVRHWSKGWFFKILLLGIFLSFVFTGVGSYFVTNHSNEIASVNDESITQQALERAYENERAMLGENFSRVFDTEEKIKQFRQNLLERLIAEKLIQETTADLHLRASDQEIRDVIRQIPDFQQQGTFSKTLYEQILKRAGINPNTFQETKRQEISQSQLFSGLIQSSFALPKEINQYYQLDHQTRDIRYATLPYQRWLAQVKVSPIDAQKYYEAHKQDYATAESIKVEYIELNLSDLMQKVALTDAQIQQAYQEHLSEYRKPAHYRVAHILRRVPKEADEKITLAARQKLEQVLMRAQKGEDFAKLAKEHSEDITAKNGGELESFEAGSMDPEFEKAAAALKQVGDISPIVQTAYGLHIVKLLGKEAETIEPFEKVKTIVADKLRRAKAQEFFYEKQTILSDKSYEFADSLKEAAQSLGLPIQESAWLTRQSSQGIAAYPAFMAAAFSDQVLNQKQNSNVVELTPSHVAVVRIKEHKPSEIQPYEAVSAQVIEHLRNQQAKQQAKISAEALDKAIEEGKDFVSLAKQQQLSMQEQTQMSRNATQVDALLRDEAFKLTPPTAGKPSAASLCLPQGDCVVIQLLAVASGDVKKLQGDELTFVQENLARQKSEIEYRFYLQYLRDSANIKYHVPTAEPSSP